MKIEHRRAFLGFLLPLAGAALTLVGRLRGTDRSSPVPAGSAPGDRKKQTSLTVAPAPHSVKRRG